MFERPFTLHPRAFAEVVHDVVDLTVQGIGYFPLHRKNKLCFCFVISRMRARVRGSSRELASSTVLL